MQIDSLYVLCLLVVRKNLFNSRLGPEKSLDHLNCNILKDLGNVISDIRWRPSSFFDSTCTIYAISDNCMFQSILFTSPYRNRLFKQIDHTNRILMEESCRNPESLPVDVNGIRMDGDHIFHEGELYPLHDWDSPALRKLAVTHEHIFNRYLVESNLPEPILSSSMQVWRLPEAWRRVYLLSQNIHPAVMQRLIDHNILGSSCVIPERYCR